MKKFFAYRKLENVIVGEWIEDKMSLMYTVNLGAFGKAKNTEELVKKNSS